MIFGFNKRRAENKEIEIYNEDRIQVKYTGYKCVNTICTKPGHGVCCLGDRCVKFNTYLASIPEKHKSCSKKVGTQCEAPFKCKHDECVIRGQLKINQLTYCN